MQILDISRSVQFSILDKYHLNYPSQPLFNLVIVKGEAITFDIISRFRSPKSTFAQEMCTKERMKEKKKRSDEKATNQS